MIPDWLQPDFSPALATLRGMARDFSARLPYFLVALALFFLAYFLARRVSRVLHFGATRAGRGVNFAVLMGRIGKTAVLAVGTLVAATIAFPSFTPATFVSLLGLGGVAAGFAFRDVLGNLLCGLFLLASEPFRIGDKISVKGFSGEVEAIQTRATTIQTLGGRRVVIPNLILFNEPVEVETAFEKRRVEAQLPVERNCEIETTRAQIQSAMESVEIVAPQPAPQVLVGEINSTHVVWVLRWWIADGDGPGEIRSRDAVLGAVWTALQAPTNE